MKVVSILLMATLAISCAKSNNTQPTQEVIASTPVDENVSKSEIETDEHVMSPEEEEAYLNLNIPGTEKATTFRFAQTTWNECKDPITGNYLGYNCATSRGISVILDSFMNAHIEKCINSGLAAQGGGTAADLHIVHAGIFADPYHSPRSLHSENRAIDIRSFSVKLTSGAVKNFVFEGNQDQKFFAAFRSCWGGVVHTYNGCPYYKGTPGLTGSIGHEDRNHQHHMHTSVPYCVNGQYGSYYYQK